MKNHGVYPWIFISVKTYYKSMLNIAKIDLVALRANAIKVKSQLKKGVKLCAVVKADAYGHGASAVSNYIYDLVDYFAVALVEEGIELRNSGIDKDILVLTPVVKLDLERAIYYNLTLTVDSKGQISDIEKECERQGRRAKIHLKYNVGMNRFGVDSLAELESLIKCASKKKWVFVEGTYSHLACPQNKKLLKSDLNKFLLANNLVKGYNKNAICHISASGGFLMGAQADMVRVGILLYGYKPFASNKISVRPVMKVYAPVLKRRSVKKGERALYGEKGLKADTEYSLIRFGYADGLERKAILGQTNNRCMDITAVSVSDKRLYPVMTNALELAQKYGTIPYEILCKISLRAEKIYLK